MYVVLGPGKSYAKFTSNFVTIRHFVLRISLFVLSFEQIIRSSSSVGANYRASQRAKSQNDFINKLKIVEEECDETIYFLQLISAVNEKYKHLLQPLINEGTEILKIIVASIKTTRNRLSTDSGSK